MSADLKVSRQCSETTSPASRILGMVAGSSDASARKDLCLSDHIQKTLRICSGVVVTTPKRRQ